MAGEEGVRGDRIRKGWRGQHEILQGLGDERASSGRDLISICIFFIKAQSALASALRIHCRKVGQGIG